MKFDSHPRSKKEEKLNPNANNTTPRDNQRLELEQGRKQVRAFNRALT